MHDTMRQLRPRLVLTLNVGNENLTAASLAQLLEGGDIATIIFYDQGHDEADFQKRLEPLIALTQQADIAALVANDSRIAGRVKADGVHIEGSPQELKMQIEHHSPQMLAGFGNATDRHTAMEVGELQPDYLFFGKLGFDLKPDAHPRNLSLGQWWASMMQIPCIVQAGNSLDSLLQAAATGSEFVALEQAIMNASDPKQALMQANQLLDEFAQ